MFSGQIIIPRQKQTVRGKAGKSARGMSQERGQRLGCVCSGQVYCCCFLPSWVVNKMSYATNRNIGVGVREVDLNIDIPSCQNRVGNIRHLTWGSGGYRR